MTSAEAKKIVSRLCKQHGLIVNAFTVDKQTNEFILRCGNKDAYAIGILFTDRFSFNRVLSFSAAKCKRNGGFVGAWQYLLEIIARYSSLHGPIALQKVHAYTHKHKCNETPIVLIDSMHSVSSVDELKVQLDLECI